MIRLNNVYKIFGDKPKLALEEAKRKQPRDKIFEKSGNLIALRNVSFEIKKGELFVIMGLSGSGKSTLIRLFNKLIAPSHGEILVDGEDIAKFSQRKILDLRRHKVSMVFQHFALMPHRSVLENIAFGLHYSKHSKAKRKEIATQWLIKVGLERFADAYPHELSGGMQQRVGLARALAVNPEVILMDEPFSALDPLIRADMHTLLLDLQKDYGKTIVFVSHDLDEALKLGDRVCILEQGEVLQIAPPQIIMTQPKNDHVRKFVANANFSRVLTALELLDNQVIEMREKSTVGEARKMLGKYPLINIVSVTERKRIKGYVTKKDIENNPAATPLSKLMKMPHTVKTSDPLLDFMYSLLENIPYVAVLDNNKFRGWVSRNSILKLLTKKQ